MKKICLFLFLITALKTYSQEYKRLYILGIGKEELLKDYISCINVFSKSIELNNNHEDDLTLADTYFHRGLCKSKLEYYSEAIFDFTKAIEINENNLNFYLQRGISSYASGASCLNDLNHCILGAQAEVKGKAFLFRGLYYKDINQINQACSDWDEALILGIETANELKTKYCKK